MTRTSHLTRAVFRGLIANRPYVSRECLRLKQPSLATIPSWQRSLNHQQRRHFLDALLGSGKPPRILEGRKATNKNLELAVGKLVSVLRARKHLTRAPSNEELVDALRFLFNARLEAGQPLTRNEVFLATNAYQHLQERGLVLADHSGSLNSDDLSMLLAALSYMPRRERVRSDYRALAELIRSDQLQVDPNSTDDTAYITILARTGSAIEARDLTLTGDLLDTDVWINVLKGLLAESRLQEFWTLLQEYRDRFGNLTPTQHEHLVATFVESDRVYDALRMFEMPVVSPKGPTSKSICSMLNMTSKHGKATYAESLAKMLLLRREDDGVLAALIVYHTAQDSSLAHLRSVVSDLTADVNIDLSMQLVNQIIEKALQENHLLAQTAEELAISAGLTPNAKTYALQLQHVLDQRDFALAQELYEKMQLEDVPEDDFDLAVFNKFIVDLSSFPDFDYQFIMRLTDNILTRGGELEPETIAALTSVFLRKGEFDELFNLLRHRIDFYPLVDRARVSAVFRTFITDPEVKVQRAFNAYELFKTAFQETPCQLRIPIMQSFFDRQRPDLACKVFSHMRESDSDRPARPDETAYMKCFEGIARCRDVDGLQAIYNMLKLDLQVQLSTKIRNSLMLAHIACRQPWQAIIDHFYKIMDSREGPTYSSFEVAMRACETWPPFGSFEARKIMAVMQSWNLEITKFMYDNYIGALAGQCEFENTVELIERMEQDIGEAPDAFTIGTFYNAIPWQYRKDEVEKWAKQAYPDLWAELETYGEEIDEEWQVRYIKLDRSIDINDPLLFEKGEWKPQLQMKMQAEIEPLPISPI